jgi:hypothetical protein
MHKRSFGWIAREIHNAIKQLKVPTYDHGLTATGDHVYYFSPEASAIALATKAFQTFDVTQCAEKPHLDGCEKVTIS